MIKLLATFAAAVLFATTALANEANAPKVDKAAGEAKFTAVCAACHGADGNSGSPEYPRIAGQSPEYLLKQMHEFKSGKRANAIMSGFASQLSDADMRNLSAWISSQAPKPNTAKDKDLVMMGERIYRGGIADRNIPACAGCHSPNGAGIPAQFPRVSGQHAAYTAAQLDAFRSGVRANNPIMSDVAAKMNDKEIKAVADYMAGLR
ncbi:MAG: c-type cytochrome [Brachymonas sp.]|jgi:cytochrome c553